MTRSHPNLKEDYFEVIDTKQKAYWLGFLYADGWITERNRFGLGVQKKDECVIENFVKALDLNIDKIETIRGQMYIRPRSNKIISDLINHGCIFKKTKKIQLPNLRNRDLYLAFLLGFFDGDGTQKRTIITTASKKFLEDIKLLFNLSFKIHIKLPTEHKMNGRKINSGKVYYMCLGAKLFNEMMDNYEHSLPRKRKYFCTEEERIERIKYKAWHGGHQKKFNITKEELEKLVWEITSEEIAKKYNISGRLVTKRCRELCIEKPPRGHWQKFRSKS